MNPSNCYEVQPYQDFEKKILDFHVLFDKGSGLQMVLASLHQGSYRHVLTKFPDFP